MSNDSKKIYDLPFADTVAKTDEVVVETPQGTYRAPVSTVLKPVSDIVDGVVKPGNLRTRPLIVSDLPIPDEPITKNMSFRIGITYRIAFESAGFSTPVQLSTGQNGWDAFDRLVSMFADPSDGSAPLTKVSIDVDENGHLMIVGTTNIASITIDNTELSQYLGIAGKRSDATWFYDQTTINPDKIPGPEGLGYEEFSAVAIASAQKAIRTAEDANRFRSHVQYMVPVRVEAPTAVDPDFEIPAPDPEEFAEDWVRAVYFSMSSPSLNDYSRQVEVQVPTGIKFREFIALADRKVTEAFAPNSTAKGFVAGMSVKMTDMWQDHKLYIESFGSISNISISFSDDNTAQCLGFADQFGGSIEGNVDMTEVLGISFDMGTMPLRESSMISMQDFLDVLTKRLVYLEDRVNKLENPI